MTKFCKFNNKPMTNDACFRCRKTGEDMRRKYELKAMYDKHSDCIRNNLIEVKDNENND